MGSKFVQTKKILNDVEKIQNVQLLHLCEG